MGVLYVRDAGNWVPLTVGAPGPAGPPGATGADGPQGPTGATGQGVPTGGATDQVLTKTSNGNFATNWQYPTPSQGGSVVGSGITGITGAVALGSVTIPAAPYARIVLCTAIVRFDNEGTGTGIMAVRIESGAVIGYGYTPPIAANQTLNMAVAIAAVSLAANTAGTYQIVAIRQSGNMSARTWNDATVNRLNVVVVPS